MSMKSCPKCNGKGHIPCTRKRVSREKAASWVQSMDRCPVVFQMPGAHPPVVGIATAGACLGGWPALRIYVGIAADGYCHPLKGQFATWLELGEINNKAVWYFDVQWSKRDRVRRLEYWPSDYDTLGIAGLLPEHTMQPHKQTEYLPYTSDYAQRIPSSINFRKGERIHGN